MSGATDGEIGAYVREKLMEAGCQPIEIDGQFFKTNREMRSHLYRKNKAVK